jgi:L-amino acid N-acyltransferase YncA
MSELVCNRKRMISIRNAKPEDLIKINEIYNQAVSEGFTGHTLPLDIKETEDWYVKHSMDTYPVFVAEVENEIAAWLSFSPYRQGRQAFRHTAEISYYLHKQHRRKGIGTFLVDYALRQAKIYHFNVLMAIVLENNEGSIRLLESAGFSRSAVLPNVAEMNGVKIGHIYFIRTL